MNQVLFTLFLFITGIAVGLPLKKQVPFTFLCISSYLWGSLIWVLAVCFLLILNLYTAPSIFFSLIVIIAIGLFFSYKKQTLQLSVREIKWGTFCLFLFIFIAFITEKFNFSITTVDGAGRILIGKSLFWDGFTSHNLAQLGHNGIFTEALQSAAAIISDDYLYTVQPLFALSLIGIFIFLSNEVLNEIKTGNLYLPRSIVAFSFMGSTYFMIFQTFYIHDNFVVGIFTLIAVSAFWLAHQQQKSGWLFFGSLATIGMSLSRVEGPVFALIILSLSLSQDQFAYRNRLWTYLIPATTVSGWYSIILTVVNQDVYFLKTDRVILVIGAFLGLALLTILSNNHWIRKIIFSRMQILLTMGVMLIFMVLVILQPAHMWTNISMIASNMFTNGRWGSFWYFILPLLFFTIPLPKIPRERLITINLVSFFLLLVALGGLRNPYRLGWSDSANRMLVHIVPTLILYLVIKYTSSWNISEQQIRAIIGKNRFVGIFIFSTVIIVLGFFFFFSRPINYATRAQVIEGAEFFKDEQPISLALRNIDDVLYAEAKNPGNLTVIIDLGKDIHANIIEMIVESDNTNASAERVLTDIGWAVSSNKNNWFTIYQPPTANTTTVRKVHTNKFQYSVEQIEVFRYLRLTYKPVNPQERLKIELINVWSHSPDGFYPE